MEDVLVLFFVEILGETLMPFVCGVGTLTAIAGAIANGALEDGGLAAIGICTLDGLNTELDDAFDLD